MGCSGSGGEGEGGLVGPIYDHVHGLEKEALGLWFELGEG